MKPLDRVARLFDFYGPLLTPRQQELVRAYYLDDLSLGEIAQGAGVSRQAVHEQLKRAEGVLQSYEERLGLVDEHLQRIAALQEVRRLLQAAAAGDAHHGALATARAVVEQLLNAEGLSE